jgi:hypothetical protein
VGRRRHSVRRVAAPSTGCSRMPGEGKGRAHTRYTRPTCRVCRQRRGNEGRWTCRSTGRSVSTSASPLAGTDGGAGSGLPAPALVQPPDWARRHGERFPVSNGPDALPRLRSIGDAREQPAQFDGGRQLASLIEDGADCCGVCFADHEHPGSMGTHAAAGKWERRTQWERRTPRSESGFSFPYPLAKARCRMIVRPIAAQCSAVEDILVRTLVRRCGPARPTLLAQHAATGSMRRAKKWRRLAAPPSETVSNLGGYAARRKGRQARLSATA